MDTAKQVAEIKSAIADLEPLFLDLEDAILNETVHEQLDRAQEFRAAVWRLVGIAESLCDFLGKQPSPIPSDN